MLAAGADDPRALELTGRMIAAHGGLERWNSAPTFSFRKLTRGPGGTQRETRAVVEQGHRRAYLDWPAENSQLVSDGKEIWTVNWHQPVPPSFVAQLDYYFLGLPWFTRDPGVHLALAGEGKLPGGTVDFAKVKMWFDEGVGDVNDAYTLYIDRETNLLRGVEYIVTHAGVVAPSKSANGRKFIGPFFRVYEDYKTIDGLMISTKGMSLNAAGEAGGVTEFQDLSFKAPFDEKRMIKPDSAVVDTAPTRSE